MTDRSTALQDTVTLSQVLRKSKDTKLKPNKGIVDKADIVSRTLDEGPRGSSLKYKANKMGNRDTSVSTNSLIRKKIDPQAESPAKMHNISVPKKDLKINFGGAIGPQQHRITQVGHAKTSIDQPRTRPKPKRLERPPQPAAGGSAVSSLMNSGVQNVKVKSTVPKKPSRKSVATQETQGPLTDRKSLLVGQESKIN